MFLFIPILTFIVAVGTYVGDFKFKERLYEREIVEDRLSKWAVVNDSSAEPDLRVKMLNALNKDDVEIKTISLKGKEEDDSPLDYIYVDDKDYLNLRIKNLGVYYFFLDKIYSNNFRVENSFVTGFKFHDVEFYKVLFENSYIKIDTKKYYGIDDYYSKNYSNIYYLYREISNDIRDYFLLNEDILEKSEVYLNNIYLGETFLSISGNAKLSQLKSIRSVLMMDGFHEFYNAEISDSCLYLSLNETNINNLKFYNSDCFSFIYIGNKTKFKKTKINNVKSLMLIVKDSALSDIYFNNVGFHSYKEIGGIFDNIEENIRSDVFGFMGIESKFFSKKNKDYVNVIENSQALRLKLYDGVFISNSNVSESFFINSNLIGSNFEGADFSNVSFLNSDLKKSKFIGSNIENTDFSGSDLSGVDFSTSTLTWFDEKTKKPLDACTEFKKAKNWHLSIRPKSLACGEKIPN